MRKKTWKASEDVLRLFQSVGRASLLYDIQDSHSGNMAMRYRDEAGNDWIVITATGSQKGDLGAGDICFLSPDETDFGYYKASSESDIHARILALEGVGASIHAHTKDLTIVTLDDAAKPNRPAPFLPVDPLGYYHLGSVVPVDWVAVPSGSAEMTRTIPERLAEHPATVVQTHGTFAKGRTLQEAFFRVCVANNAGAVVRRLRQLKVDIEGLRERVRAAPDEAFSYPPSAYTVGDDHILDFPEETEILREFSRAGARIFESRLSPFHSGSMSVRGVESMLYAPKASMPREIGGPLRKVTLENEDNDPPELRIHKQIYAGSDFQTVIHCYVPEAEAQAHFIYPGEKSPLDRIVPIDAEGSFIHLVVPVVPPRTGISDLVRLLHDYKMVVVRGGGVWAVGAQSLSEALHHPSSLREICLYRNGAFEQGLDLRKMEPEKAKKW
ncbi:MAG TPA: class II aldolase/adducin family protein [Candidatus Desulfaltia sp.]|nr:class II aldolase/adducin family protein [Candidatus Desulfaltia sp.]